MLAARHQRATPLPSRPNARPLVLTAKAANPHMARTQQQRPAADQWLLATSSAVLSLLLAVAPPAVAAEEFKGPARIVDGDTLYIGKDKVRLYGVDAPEKAQTCTNARGQPYDCGKVALTALTDHVANNNVRCQVKNKDQYGRNVAACYLASGLPGQRQEDIGQWLVSNGLAVAYRAYSTDYIAAEDQAHQKRVGVWQGDFTMPADWRKQQRNGGNSNNNAAPTINYASSTPAASGGGSMPAPSALDSSLGTANALVDGARSFAAVVGGVPASPVLMPTPFGMGGVVVAAPPVCGGRVIKGNINAKGEKIYHTVKSGQYERVVIELDKGEKYFCTEQEALAAGWRSALK